MARALLLIILPIMLTACGFKPLYGSHHTHLGLAEIEVGKVSYEGGPDRMAVAMRSNLEDALNPKRLHVPQKYQLNLSLSKSKDIATIQNNTTATRTKITATVHYRLVDKNTGKEISKGIVKAIDSFDVAESQYSTFISEEETYVRITKILAQELKMRLAGSI